MCFGCSKEPSYRDGSFEYPQHMFCLRNKKNNFQLCTLIREGGGGGGGGGGLIYIMAMEITCTVNVLKFITAFSFCSQIKCWFHKMLVRIAKDPLASN